MDISLLIRHRLKELDLEQKDLAAAAEVTESYISQLLARKKAPPSPGRTDIYEKIAKVLRLPSKELSRLADAQRREELKRKVLDPPRPLFQDFRQSLEGQIRVDCRLNCFACGILPTFANMRRENPGEVWKCPDVKSPASSKKLSVASNQLPVVGD